MKPQSTLCHCEALASLRHAYLGSLFWTQRILRVSVWGPSGTSVKVLGSFVLISDYGAICLMA